MRRLQYRHSLANLWKNGGGNASGTHHCAASLNKQLIISPDFKRTGNEIETILQGVLERKRTSLGLSGVIDTLYSCVSFQFCKVMAPKFKEM